MDQDLLGDHDFLRFGGAAGRSFDEFAVVERRTGTDEGDEVWCVHRSPPGLRGLDELERHRQTGGAGARALRDLAPVPNGGEGRLDRIGGSQVHPMLGRVVVELEQHVQVVGDLRGGLGNFVP